jgi:hypothetical protein
MSRQQSLNKTEGEFGSMMNPWALSALWVGLAGIAKYNRLLEIERELGSKARYAGACIYEHWKRPVKA